VNAAQIKVEVSKHAEVVATDLRRGWVHVRIDGLVYMVWICKAMTAELIARCIADAPRYSRCLSFVAGSKYAA
jgi:hypothetical protein